MEMYELRTYARIQGILLPIHIVAGFNTEDESSELDTMKIYFDVEGGKLEVSDLMDVKIINYFEVLMKARFDLRKIMD